MSRPGCRRRWRPIIALCAAPMIAHAGGGVAHAGDALAAADLRPWWGVPSVSPLEAPVRFGFAIDGLSNGGPYVSPALWAAFSPWGWQSAAGGARWLARSSLELRSPVAAEQRIAADIVRTLGETLAAEPSLSMLRRWAEVGLFARGLLRAGLVEAELRGGSGSDRIQLGLAAVGAEVGLELRSVLLVARGSYREVWLRAGDSPDFAGALEGPDLGFGAIVRLTPLFWLQAQSRPFGGIDAPGRWALGLTGCFWPFDDPGISSAR